MCHSAYGRSPLARRTLYPRPGEGLPPPSGPTRVFSLAALLFHPPRSAAFAELSTWQLHRPRPRLTLGLRGRGRFRIPLTWDPRPSLVGGRADSYLLLPPSGAAFARLEPTGLPPFRYDAPRGTRPGEEVRDGSHADNRGRGNRGGIAPTTAPLRLRAGTLRRTPRPFASGRVTLRLLNGSIRVKRRSGVLLPCDPSPPRLLSGRANPSIASGAAFA